MSPSLEQRVPANEVKSAPASGSPDISELVQRLEAWAQYWRGGSSIHMLPENGLVDSLYEAAQVLRALEEERDELVLRRREIERDRNLVAEADAAMSQQEGK